MSFGYSFEFQGLDLNDSALDNMLNSPTGEVGQYLHAKGMQIVAGAQAQVGVETGRLRDSIEIQNHSRAGVGQMIQIGSDVPYAYAHHEGTNAHTIDRPGQNLLRFSGGGRTIYTHRVNHPGNRPNRFLSDQLRLI